ncbi:MAG: hypothetical protein L3J44_07330 [Campylobacteraceae bacterium]|nr:hypothetical protein [Campylobacteraceae bacterium]
MKISFIYIVLLLLLQNSIICAKNIELDSLLVSRENYKIKTPIGVKIAKKRGDYVLASLFSDDEEMVWANKFNIAELGGVDDVHITSKLMIKKGALKIRHHIGYDWMPAFYYYTNGKNRKYVDWLYKNREKMTLNPNGPFLHCKKNGYDWCEDFYYNYGDKKLLESRVDDLLKNMKSKRFNGLFFDWASGRFIDTKEYKSIENYFLKQSPKMKYFEFIGKFYKTLKNRGVFVVTNQAFRKEKYLLKHVTYDMTESYITTDTVKKIKLQIVGIGWVDSIKVTNYYPIYKNSKTIKDSLHFIDILTKYKKKYKKYGFKNFIYLNYIAPDYERVYDSVPLYRLKKPKNAIYFSYAMAKLTDNMVYAQIAKNKDLERDDIYFYDLGKPLDKSYKKLSAIDAYIRFYENGFVLASSAYKRDIYLKILSLHIPKKRDIYDAYNDTWLYSDGKSVNIKLNFKKDIFSHKYLPAGRVYLYSKN